jgi:AraC-like DNA-binding protein
MLIHPDDMTDRPRLLEDRASQGYAVAMSTFLEPADPLGEALHFLRMSGTYYSRCEFSAPWGLELPELAGSLMFHVVTRGMCTLDVPGSDPRVLRPGSLALVPHGEGHRLRSDDGVPAVNLFDLPREEVSDRYEIVRIDGGGPAVTLICGVIRFDHPAGRQLLSLLPRTIQVDGETTIHHQWLQTTLHLMAHEARTLRPGGETIITRLADVLVIQAIRSWLEQDPDARAGWLGAMRDPQIGRALSLIHRAPEQEWTVAQLAHEVAMSRSAFSARFTDLVGESPMRYVARWRMSVALTMLTEGTAALAEIAARLGYRSEAAFSRAFKRTVGVAPGAARTAGRAVS